MSTIKSQYYSWTPKPAKKVGPRKWISITTLYRKDIYEFLPEAVVEIFEGVGSAENSAMNDGLRQAKARAEMLGKPKDWRGRVVN
jgi:hypothetical protein